MSASIIAFALVSKENRLSLGSITASREDAERKLKAEFPVGYVIYDGYRIVEIEIIAKTIGGKPETPPQTGSLDQGAPNHFDHTKRGFTP